MAEIDLEELKRMVAMRDGADDKWAVAADKALHASAPVLARRVLELTAERDAWRDAAQDITPGGSEFTTPAECLERARQIRTDLHEARCATVRERRRAEGLAAEVERLGRVAASELEAREKCDRALRMKDGAMGEPLNRLQTAGIDCSDLIP